MGSTDSFEILPLELLVTILSFLDPVYLHAVKFVCRRFKVCSGKPLGNPLLQAIKDKNKEMIQWCINQKFFATDQEFLEFAKQGDLEHIKLLNGSLQDLSTRMMPSQMCTIATQYGHLQILQYFDSSIKWNDCFFQQQAAFYGQLHILEYVYELNPEYLKFDSILRATFDGNQLHIYKWICKLYHKPIHIDHIDGIRRQLSLEFIKELGPEKIKNIFVGSYAPQYPEMMEWLHENGFLHKGYYAHISHQGDLGTIKWLKDLGYELGEDELKSIIQEAAKGGHVHILEWINENYKIQNYYYYELIMKAHGYRHVNILKWVNMQYKYPLDFNRFGFFNCPANVSLESLDWLNEKGYNFPRFSCDETISHNNLANLEWFYTHGYPLSNNAYNIAARGGYLHIIHWLKKHNIPFDLDKIACNAAEKGHLHIVEWVKEVAKEADKLLPKTIMDKACKHSQIHILKWGVINGLPIPKYMSKKLLKEIPESTINNIVLKRNNTNIKI